MIYFFYGTDREKVLAKARGTFEALEKKKPDATFVGFGSENFSLSELEAITGSQGLFEHKIVARLTDILSNKEVADDIVKKLPEMKSTDNIIVWSEGEVTKAILDKIKRQAEKTEEFLIRGKSQGREFNIFALSDALGAKDRKKFWQLIIEALDHGSAPEEIHGTLWWQLKSIALAKKIATAEEAGLKPFVYSKAKSFARNWSDQELNLAMTYFVDMYHKSHRGESDFMVALEKFSLKI